MTRRQICKLFLEKLMLCFHYSSKKHIFFMTVYARNIVNFSALVAVVYLHLCFLIKANMFSS